MYLRDNIFVIVCTSIAITTVKITTVSGCVDDPGFQKNGQGCGALVTDTVFNECYDNSVETSCCASCAEVRLTIPGCPYGDNATCYAFLCGSYIDLQLCCFTCYEGTVPPATVATDAPTTTTTQQTTTTPSFTSTPSPLTTVSSVASSTVKTNSTDASPSISESSDATAVAVGTTFGVLGGIGVCILIAYAVIKLKKPKEDAKPDDCEQDGSSRNVIGDIESPVETKNSKGKGDLGNVKSYSNLTLPIEKDQSFSEMSTTGNTGVKVHEVLIHKVENEITKDEDVNEPTENHKSTNKATALPRVENNDHVIKPEANKIESESANNGTITNDINGLRTQPENNVIPTKVDTSNSLAKSEYMNVEFKPENSELMNQTPSESENKTVLSTSEENDAPAKQENSPSKLDDDVQSWVETNETVSKSEDGINGHKTVNSEPMSASGENSTESDSKNSSRSNVHAHDLSKNSFLEYDEPSVWSKINI